MVRQFFYTANYKNQKTLIREKATMFSLVGTIIRRQPGHKKVEACVGLLEFTVAVKRCNTHKLIVRRCVRSSSMKQQLHAFRLHDSKIAKGSMKRVPS